MAYTRHIRRIIQFLPSVLIPAVLLALPPAAHARDMDTAENAVNDDHIIRALDAHIEKFESIDTADLDNLLDRIGDARLVLLGESTHGTREFYEMRARISRALIENKGFDVIALEADWPDVTRIEQYIQSDPRPPLYRQNPFSSFQGWMWRNRSFMAFTEWLRTSNLQRTDDDKVHIYGLDLYNMQGSMRLVMDYLQSVDRQAAGRAWQSYRCMADIVAEPGRYGHLASSGQHPVCQREAESVVHLLVDNAHRWKPADPNRYFHALYNASLVARDEYFFRRKFSSDADADRDSWNYREQTMLESIRRILAFHGPDTKIIIWAHNTHIGDSAATVMADDDRRNLGERVRQAFPGQSYLIGFATNSGTVTAAADWHLPAQIMRVPPSHELSYGHVMYRAAADNFMLPLRDIEDVELDRFLHDKHGQRAIGVTYDPQNEVEKHYLNVRLADQFDELIWFDHSTAVQAH